MSEKDTEKDTLETNSEDQQGETDKEQTLEEIKAEAERLEAENKTLKAAVVETDEETIKKDQLRRLEKAREKNAALKSHVPKEALEPKVEIAVDDLITLREQGFAKDSDEAKLLRQFREAGLIDDYQTGLNDVAVKAKLEAIKQSRTAASVLDENGSPSGGFGNTAKDAIRRYKSTGEVPTEPTNLDAVAKNNLSEMSL